MHPPKLPLRFFRWYCHPALRKYIEGDLMELYDERKRTSSKWKADIRFCADVLLLFRPGIIKPPDGYKNVNQYAMYKSYFKIGFRNLLRNKGYSLINIGGLAMGMSIAILIGLWIHDEFSFNKYHKNYDRIAQIMKGASFEGKNYLGQRYMPFPLIEELSTTYAGNFKHVIPFQGADGFLGAGDKTISGAGAFAGEGIAEMLTLEMVHGTWAGLKDPHSILLSTSLAKALFGEGDPVNKVIQFNNKTDLKVTGVYNDIPYNSRFNGTGFFIPWDLQVSTNPWMKNQGWENHFLFIFAEIAANTTVEKVNENIHEAEIKAITNIPALANELKYNPVVMLHPMANWHLLSNFKDGVQDYGPVQSVKIIAIIGAFVLLLACINFMNLSTARSEKRAKEVGIRKSIGSYRSQLVNQFFSESILVVVLAFIVSLIAVSVAMPWFNDLTGKGLAMPWLSLSFWITSLLFILFTGVIAGSYPALYLSSFNAVKVLKGTFRAGRMASMPRKVLVVLQFTVSVSLIIGTIVIYNQVMHAKDRPMGYSREGLIMVNKKTDEFHKHSALIHEELKKTGMVSEVAESGGEMTGVWSGNGGFSWEGGEPSDEGMGTLSVSATFGKTVGWEFVDGRDFSKDIASDSSGFIFNEAAIKFMNMKDPVGKIVHWKNTANGVDSDFKIIGVIKNMVMDSPFEPVEPAVYFLRGWHGIMNIKINPAVSASKALPVIESVFKKIIPTVPFDYKFVDEQFAHKFVAEERVGKLASVFSVLAILISSLGLFGLASFVAEQRTKEIGIRKVVGASIFSLWKMLSGNFVLLTLISCTLATPLAYYGAQSWLQSYTYRIDISWWIFVSVCAGAILITLLTVSYQAIKAALINPVKSLRSE